MGMNSNDINDLQAEIARLNEKIAVMRSLLWEWNCSSDMVWEYWKLKQVGEKREDYAAFLDDEDGVDMPLFDQDDRDFMERL
jgi:hypothetical protein